MNNDELVKRMTDGIEAVMSAETRNNIVPRFNQAKTVACLHAQFRVHDDLPETVRHGLFSRPATYPAILRFANAVEQDDSKKDVRGLSIRVMNVDGPVLWGEAGYQDFLLNSYPALFVATPEDFLAFIEARRNNRKLWFFINPFDPHLKSLWIALKARQRHLSPLDIRYWSTVPFRLGIDTGLAVKYSVIPASDHRTTQPVEPGPDQLRAAIRQHLETGQAVFHFAVQPQTDPNRMPIEDASVIWDETISPFQTVATITIEQQAFDDAGSLAECERRSFNPWQCLAEHEPLGKMNEVRRLVYANAAQFRNRGAQQ